MCPFFLNFRVYFFSVKSILRSLNLPQRKAILRVLMSKDYVLIKGYPGTGERLTLGQLHA